jgi:hypothetical protein
MKCPHCGCEILDGEDFALQAPRAKPVRESKQKSRARIGEGEDVILMPAVGGDVAICSSIVCEWGEVYPAVDIPATLREIRQWVLANPNRRKVNVRAFVVNWLKREQDRS